MQKPPKNPAAQALGRLGGAANTVAQNRARRHNAQHAGRPRRVCVHCGEPVTGGHVDRTLDTSCGQHGWRWQQGRDGRPVDATGATATLAAIVRELDGRSWSPDTLDAIAVLARQAGYRIRNPRRR